MKKSMSNVRQLGKPDARYRESYVRSAMNRMMLMSVGKMTLQSQKSIDIFLDLDI